MTETERIVLIEERLKMGGDAFAELRARMGKLAWYGVGCVGAAIAVAFSAGQVVSEIHDARRIQVETQGQLEQIRSATTALERRQDRIETALEGVQKTINTKLDAALAADPITGRRRQR